MILIPTVFPKSTVELRVLHRHHCHKVIPTVVPKSTDAPVMELVDAFNNVGFETKGADSVMELVESLKNISFK